jgi:hypothetical protein
VNKREEELVNSFKQKIEGRKIKEIKIHDIYPPSLQPKSCSSCGKWFYKFQLDKNGKCNNAGCSLARCDFRRVER